MSLRSTVVELLAGMATLFILRGAGAPIWAVAMGAWAVGSVAGVVCAVLLDEPLP